MHLLADQIEFADVVILNKVDDAGPQKIDAARKIIRSLNADAEIIETHQFDVATDKILDTGLSAPLRQWPSEAALPWSPASVRRIWSKSKAKAKGMTPEETLLSLNHAETLTLARDRYATSFKLNSST